MRKLLPKLAVVLVLSLAFLPAFLFPASALDEGWYSRFTIEYCYCTLDGDPLDWRTAAAVGSIQIKPDRILSGNLSFSLRDSLRIGNKLYNASKLQFYNGYNAYWETVDNVSDANVTGTVSHSDGAYNISLRYSYYSAYSYNSWAHWFGTQLYQIPSSSYPIGNGHGMVENGEQPDSATFKLGVVLDVTTSALLDSLGTLSEEVRNGNKTLEELVEEIKGDKYDNEVADVTGPMDDFKDDANKVVEDAKNKNDAAEKELDKYDKAEEDFNNDVSNLLGSLDKIEKEKGIDRNSFHTSLQTSISSFFGGFEFWGKALGYILEFPPVLFLFYIFSAMGILFFVMNVSFRAVGVSVRRADSARRREEFKESQRRQLEILERRERLKAESDKK